MASCSSYKRSAGLSSILLLRRSVSQLIVKMYLYTFILSVLLWRSAAAFTKCNGAEDICDLRIDQFKSPGSRNTGSGFDGILKSRLKY